MRIPFFIVFLIGTMAIEDHPVAKFATSSNRLLPRQKAPFFSATAVTPDLKFNKISLSDFEGINSLFRHR